MADTTDTSVDEPNEGADEPMADGVDEAMADGVDEAMADGADEAIADGVNEAMADGADEAMADDADEAMADDADEAMADDADEPTVDGSSAGAIEQPPSPAARMAGIAVAAVVTLLATAAMYFAYDPKRAGDKSVLYIAGGSYAALALITLIYLWRRGELKARFMPFRGDITIGALSAGVLYMVSFVGAGVLLPVDSPRSAWLMRIYLHLGDPRTQSALLLGLSILVVAALEEIVWRGMVMRALFDVMSQGRAVLLTAALYGLAHVTTLTQLGDANAGFNPLLVAAAAGCGTIWGAMAWRFGRLPPAIFAHALFSWAIVEFPLWQLPLG